LLLAVAAAAATARAEAIDQTFGRAVGLLLDALDWGWIRLKRWIQHNSPG
jgi:hypothetical protein